MNMHAMAVTHVKYLLMKFSHVMPKPCITLDLTFANDLKLS